MSSNCQPPRLRKSRQGGSGLPGGRVDRSAVAEVDVEKAVAVGVEERHAASHDLGQVVLAARAVVESERDPRLRGDLFEDDSGSRILPAWSSARRLEPRT